MLPEAAASEVASVLVAVLSAVLAEEPPQAARERAMQPAIAIEINFFMV